MAANWPTLCSYLYFGPEFFCVGVGIFCHKIIIFLEWPSSIDRNIWGPSKPFWTKAYLALTHLPSFYELVIIALYFVFVFAHSFLYSFSYQYLYFHICIYVHIHPHLWKQTTDEKDFVLVLVFLCFCICVCIFVIADKRAWANKATLCLFFSLTFLLVGRTQPPKRQRKQHIFKCHQRWYIYILLKSTTHFQMSPKMTNILLTSLQQESIDETFSGNCKGFVLVRWACVWRHIPS